MRSLFLLFCQILFISIHLQGQNTSLEKPAEYNNFIVEEQNKLILKIIEYNISSLHNDNYEENNQKRLDIIRQLNASIERLKALAPFNGDSRLRDEALSVFKIYKEAYDIEFNEVNLLRKDRTGSFEAMEKYFKAQNNVEEKLKSAGVQFMNAQKAFAKKFNTTLKENDTKNQLEDIVKVNQYSRNIFLEYFRVSAIDEVFLSALNNQQSYLMDEKRKEIIQATEISLQKIYSVIPFKSDSIYKDKAIELLQYHKNLAEKEYKELVLIIQKKDNLTQKDIDQYNLIVTEINNTSQKMVEELNKENKEMLKRNLPAY